MKIKTFFLASFAFVFAIAGAIASTFVPADAWVKARITANGEIQCVNTRKQCSNTSNQLCSVSVPTSKPGTGGATIADSNGPFYVFVDSECETVLYNDFDMLQSSTVQTYELIP